MFPFCDMFEGDDDFDELSLRSRDHAPDEDAYISRNRQIILGKDFELDDTQPLLLPDPTTGKSRNKKEPDKVTVVDIIETKENKEDEPDEILVDLNK